MFGHLAGNGDDRGEAFLFYSYAHISGGALLIALCSGAGGAPRGASSGQPRGWPCSRVCLPAFPACRVHCPVGQPAWLPDHRCARCSLGLPGGGRGGCGRPGMPCLSPSALHPTLCGSTDRSGAPPCPCARRRGCGEAGAAQPRRGGAARDACAACHLAGTWRGGARPAAGATRPSCGARQADWQTGRGCAAPSWGVDALQMHMCACRHAAWQASRCVFFIHRASPDPLRPSAHGLPLPRRVLRSASLPGGGRPARRR